MIFVCCRYVIPIVEWTRLAQLPASNGLSPVAFFVTRLQATVDRLVTLTLSVLSTPEEMTAVTAADVSQQGASGASVPDGAATAIQGQTEFLNDEDMESCMGPEAQIITCACWMSTKEAALVLGTLCQVAPTGKATSLLPAGVLLEAGETMLRVLLECKHTGAVDKTQQAFTALCTALLAEPAAELAGQPHRWLTRVLSTLRRPGQSRRDIIRRSSGLPLALQGLMQAQASGTPGSLVVEGMTELLRTASGEDGLEEQWPRVHAFNTLRLLYLDTKLTRGASVFYSEGQLKLIHAVPHCCVAIAALLCFQNVRKINIAFSVTLLCRRPGVLHHGSGCTSLGG